MATFFKWEADPQDVGSIYSFWRIALIGAALGAIYWGLTALLSNYVNSTSISGDISTIVIAVLGIIVMMRLNMAQPLAIAVASGSALWGLSLWTSGLVVGEIIAWSVLLYTLAYAIFSWVARYTHVVPVLICIALVVVSVRIVIAL